MAEPTYAQASAVRRPSHTYAAHPLGQLVAGEPVEITGVLEREPEIAPERLYLQFRLETIRPRGVEQNSSGVVLLLAPVPRNESKQEFDQLELRYGARVRVMTMLERADSF